MDEEAGGVVKGVVLGVAAGCVVWGCVLLGVLWPWAVEGGV